MEKDNGQIIDDSYQENTDNKEIDDSGAELESAEEYNDLTVLRDMLRADKNLKMKTEIQNPREQTSLQLWARDFSSNSILKEIGDDIDFFINEQNINMVSNQRQSRTETYSTLSHKREKDEYKDTLEDFKEEFD